MIDGPAGAFIGGILGLAFGYLTEAILTDEAGCIWWWWGKSYDAWLKSNLWWLTALGGSGMGIAASVLLTSGYLRIGSYTFVDAIGVGNP